MKRLIAKLSLLLALSISTLSLSANAVWANSHAGGGWNKKSFSIAGNWSIDGNVLTLSDDFKTKSAPDLKIFLSTTALAKLNGDNATRNAVLISPLASASGGQQYQLPAGIDLSQFSTIIIHCERYSKLWGGAPL